MKRFELVFALSWVTVFLTVVYLSIATLKKEPQEKMYLEDNAVIYNR